MIDPQTPELLQDVLRRESRSLLAYIKGAYPWATAVGDKALSRLRGLIHDESEALAALGRFLVRHRVPLPYIASYPSGFTAINFIALASLLPRLAAAERESLPEVERDLAAIHDPDWRAPVQRLVEVKRRNLAALEELEASYQEPAMIT